MTEFYIGQIFENEYPLEAADFCNNRGDCYIEEIETIDDVRRFQIVEVPEETEEEKARRIAMLSLTRGDVFRGLLMAKGVTRAQLRAMIESNEGLTEIEREMALIDFDEALNFYRGNTLIDTVGLALGITSAQLDEFFMTNDYTKLTSAEEQSSEAGALLD